MRGVGPAAERFQSALIAKVCLTIQAFYDRGNYQFQSALIAKVCLTKELSAAVQRAFEFQSAYDREGLPHVNPDISRSVHNVSIRFDREGLPHSQFSNAIGFLFVSIRFDREGLPHLVDGESGRTTVSIRFDREGLPHWGFRRYYGETIGFQSAFDREGLPHLRKRAHALC